jgi:hypothetical protein
MLGGTTIGSPGLAEPARFEPPAIPSLTEAFVAAYLVPDPAILSPDLVARKTVTLGLEGLPSLAPFEVHMGDQVLAAGVADERGAAVVPGFTAPQAGEAMLTSGAWARALQVLDQATQRSRPFDLAAVPLEGPPDDGGVGSDASYTILKTEEYRYGHWKGVGEWRRIDNDGNAAQRYYETVTRFFGTGDTNQNPYHLWSTWNQVAEGLASDGNTFVNDYDPTSGNPTQSTVTYTISAPPAVSYSWQQIRPGYFTAQNYFGEQSPNDEDGYQLDINYWDSGHNFQGKMESAISGTVPTGHTGWMWLKMYHKSCANSFCWTTYQDDAGWKYVTITWS